MPTRVLMTGATGFIGRNLAPALAAEERLEVESVDRAAGFDLSDPGWTARLPAGADVVVHLAQSRGYREFPAAADDIFRVNVAATFELLEWSRKHRVRRFLFASTGNVYERRAGRLEEGDGLAPQSFYDATKLTGEHLVEQYSEFFQTVVMRIFGVYGPGQEDMLVPLMIQRVGSGEEITLAQGAGVHMTPLYIDDCTEMIKELVTSERLERHNVFNLAGSEAVHLGDVVRHLERILGKRANVVLRADETPVFLQGRNDRIRRATGVVPRHDLEQGLAMTIQGQAKSP